MNNLGNGDFDKIMASPQDLNQLEIPETNIQPINSILGKGKEANAVSKCIKSRTEKALNA